MNFYEALVILEIEKYEVRIIKSNSHGELLHLQQYFVLAENLGKTEWFKEWFDLTVEFAEENWERPESVFQHIAKLLTEFYNNNKSVG